MSEMKFEKKETLSRKEAADRLSKIAAALAAEGAFELKQGNEKLKVDVAARVAYEFEIEIDDDECQIEVEMKWVSPAPKPAAGTEPPAEVAAVVEPAAGSSKKPVAKRPAATKPATKKPAPKKAPR